MSMRRIFNDTRFFWLLLAIPAIAMFIALANGAEPGRLIHGTGEFAARFMIVAMLLSPLKLIFNNVHWVAWLLRRRRAIGVAAFLYALAHTVLYLVDMGTLQAILDELGLLGIWTGWAAIIIFIPLAITSNNTMVRVLKSGWKKLQRLVYVAAVLTLTHWITVHNNTGPAIVHFLPLALAEAYRIYRWVSNRRQRATPDG